jgi:hypothetical protein
MRQKEWEWERKTEKLKNEWKWGRYNESNK